MAFLILRIRKASNLLLPGSFLALRRFALCFVRKALSERALYDELSF
ncbi:MULTISPECIES: hypothetical protein [Acetobacter]|uniref:Transposase n=1 Tax=Acetobacter thailandicus TaxID=1502842 RepID=A0ABT3QET4_9PROT|nr:MULTISPECIES: hypothetical protein [Acetobacter]MBS0959908.1 hypothetical protein [Acetobacter thailandicus]MBS0979237.1 hypothetical protein [Acetobacter thailandicus]MBS0985757.1 hypothetical protein [Acetobacter thailandicus]MBS1002355.1 hypothetical protein [Acetobacter thailandicus]MCX2563765.1 hypothetical protein [Acetobacter thailandicus]